jgi:methylmalonyl-CoA/ethylmalonyl-CoA epimerase
VSGLPTLHHFGIIVASIDGSAESVCRSMNAEWTHRVSHDPIQKVRVTFLTQANSSALIELVEPASPDSPVQRFLAAGGGLNHLCYEVDDLDAHITAMKQSGSRLLRSPKPAVAFDMRRIAWMLTAERTLVEYLERAR